MIEQRQAGASSEHRIQAEREVGSVEHFFDLGTDNLGHAHAAVLRRACNADPAIVGVGAIGLGETIRGDNSTVLPAATLFIATAIERRNDLSDDLARLLKDGLGGIGINVLCQCWNP
ncbi:hypothetical protein D3C77_636870 [compost metagenome]